MTDRTGRDGASDANGLLEARRSGRPRSWFDPGRSRPGWARAAASLLRRRLRFARRPSPLAAHLQAQISSAAAGAAVAAAAMAGTLEPVEARARIDGIEHDGDRHRSELVASLSRALTTPVDREDIYRFSRSIDDVLDNLRDVVREWDLYGAPPAPGLEELLGLVGVVLSHLERAVVLLDRAPAEVAGSALEARKACNRIRYRFQDELAQLFRRPVDGHVLQLRELYRRLDVVGLRLGEAADVLADASVKRTLL